MLQPSEVIDLVIALVLLPIIVSSSAAVSGPRRRLILGAFGTIAAGYVFTIIEGFALPDLFNTLEHASHAVAGVLTLVVLVNYGRGNRASRGGVR